jgi:hypothetical protein
LQNIFFREAIQVSRFFAVVGYNGRGFFRLWDTTEEFFPLWIQRRGYPPMWDTTEEDFFRCGIHRRTISQESIPLYHTPQQNLMQCTVTQKNLWHYIPQRRRFSSVESHNGRYFPPLWDTTEEIFFVMGCKKSSFPPLWDTTEEVFSFLGYKGKKLYNAE